MPRTFKHVMILVGLFITSLSHAVPPENDLKLTKRVDQLTKSIPEKPGPDADDLVWDSWREQNYEIRKNRINAIDELKKRNLSEAQLKPYLVMQLDDIEDCFYHSRVAGPNRYESILYKMKESGNALEKNLSTELFWGLNIYYVNTHLMHLSEEDIQQIADFELSRKNQPEAGRLMAKAIKLGRLSQDAKAKWSTWVIEKIPAESEGHQLISARNQAKADIGKEINFNGVDLNGNEIDLKDYRGKVVLVDYWAFWCGFCLQEIPEIKEVYREYYDKGFRVIGVFNDYRTDELKAYIKGKQIQWPQLVSPDASKSSYLHPLAKKYGISSLPNYLLIDREGKLIKAGSSRIELLKPKIEELLKQ